MDVMEMWRLIYQEELPKDIGNARELLQDYSGLKADNVEAHLYAIVRARLPYDHLRFSSPAHLFLPMNPDHI